MVLKTFWVLLVLTSAAAAQPFGAGFKIGLPLNDAFELQSTNNLAGTLKSKKYIIGPQFELRLPAGFSIEFDALYTSFRVDTISGVAGNLLAPFDADSWEFPLLLKKKFGGPSVVAVSAKPFVDVGASFRRLGDIGNIGGFITGNNNDVDKSATGFVVGGGVEIRLLFIRFSPEFRFTRWGTDNLRAGVTNILSTNRNQGQLLVGIHF